MTITPLDTCGIVRLEGKKYEKVLKSKNPVARAVIEKLGIRVSDKGYTVIEDGGKVIGCATEWKDLDGFKDFLVERLAK